MNSRPLSRLALAALAGLALAGAGRAALAEEDQPEAVKLFDKGRKLMERASTLDEGCRTLEESLKLWDRGDTVLNLALCHRRQGKTATAWTEFNRALTHGTKVGFPEAIQEATRQRDELATILSKVTITVPPKVAALPGLTVELDGAPFARELWNVAFVRDPGPVRVRAEAKGYKPFEARVELGAKKDEKRIVLALEAAPAPLPPPPPPPPPPPLKRARPVWPWVVGGVGVALGAAAIGAEIVSVKAHKELDDKCGAGRQSCPVGYDFNPARSREIIGFGLFAGLGTGGVLALGAAGVGLGLSSRPVTMGDPQRVPQTPPQGPSTSLVLSPTSIGLRTTF